VARFDNDETARDIGAYEHVDHLRIDVSVSTVGYSVYIDGATMEPGSIVDWRAKTPHGDHAGTFAVIRDRPSLSSQTVLPDIDAQGND
jgi:hypothetical protein